ncbi:unnamed protein product [Ectocarpus sp. 4 AP-2014]
MTRKRTRVASGSNFGILLGGATLLLAMGISDAFAAAGPSTIGTIGLDTTLPMDAATFWRFAHSKDFYRSTRQQSAGVRQQVVDLTSWEQTDGIDAASTESRSESAPAPPPIAAPAAPASRLERIVPMRRQQHQQQQQEQQHQEEQDRRQQQQQDGIPQPRPQLLLQRRATLNYAITSPFGSSDAKVVQEHTLLDDRHQEGGGGGICYTESDCITGFPMVPGDLSVKTTFLVTPVEDAGHAQRVRVRVEVVVEEIELPKRLRFLSKRVSNIVGNGGRRQAEKWLGEMVKEGSPAADP